VSNITLRRAVGAVRCASALQGVGHGGSFVIAIYYHNHTVKETA